MSEESYPRTETVQKILEQLSATKLPAGVSEDVLRQVIAEWLLARKADEGVALDSETARQLIERALDRSRFSSEQRRLRARMAVTLTESLEDLDTIVARHFDGASREIAGRHLEAVREERSQRITEGILQALGGREATLGTILESAGDAVVGPIIRGLKALDAKPELTDIAVAQVALATSQAVQQVAFNVQKIITVAIEEARSADHENPRYKPPY